MLMPSKATIVSSLTRDLIELSSEIFDIHGKYVGEVAGLNQESHSGLAKAPGSSEEIELWIKRLLGSMSGMNLVPHGCV
jgi:hypothetical protein